MFNCSRYIINQSIYRLKLINKNLSSSVISMSSVDNVIKNYDYLVIGGGSGGVASARRAASYGAKVLLIESNFEKLGGTCVNVGCVPKKIMWYAGDLAHKTTHLNSYGLLNDDNYNYNEFKHGDFNWTLLKEKRDLYVKRLNKVYSNNLAKEGVEFLYGFAKFIDSFGNIEVTLTNDQEISFLKPGKFFKKDKKLKFSANKILIATGGESIIPKDITGNELGITSDGFFELKEQPKSVAIVGAGYIGVELSGIFKSLGTKTNLIIRGDTVLRSFDESIQSTITDYYINKLGINIIKQSGSVTKVRKSDDGKKKIIYLGNNETLEVDELIWTIGRKSLINIGLDKADVKVNKKNQIIVDEYQQTSNPRIFALGDVVGKVELTPVAIAAGRRLSNRLFSGDKCYIDDKLDYNNIPSVVFSHPEVGSIGLTTKQAKEKYDEANIKIYKAKFISMYYSMMNSDDLKSPTFYKMIVAGPEEKIVGLHLIGDNASEILQGFSVAIKMGATKKDFDNCVAIHPTSAEELVTMK